MSLILDLINGINKFLGYLDISPKYLNRAYTFLSVFPTLYILRIVYGMFRNGNHLQGVIYLLIFVALVYFLLLNIQYHFRGKNSKLDITQLFVKYLPDDAFNIQQEKGEKERKMQSIDTENVEITFMPEYQLHLATCMEALIQTGQLKTNDLSIKEGYLVDWNTIYPYYFIKKSASDCYELQIGTSYQELIPIGTIQTTRAFHPVGLYIIGGDFVKDGFRYHEPYRLKLLAKKTETVRSETPIASRSQRRKNK